MPILLKMFYIHILFVFGWLVLSLMAIDDKTIDRLFKPNSNLGRRLFAIFGFLPALIMIFIFILIK